ncbi:potassium transporter [Candidatus Magnetobacterium bavaricum]|uniref:Potassium transporter n=1 Tax=Candidatus Magnetobacterium bavaricum TaxID=29290 RepID=A0A0F3GM81_9BACT|nr:potassium transporter [Candidatus Magnetobacterium bavaricum]
MRKSWALALLSLFVFLVDIVYLSSNTFKIPHGGYWSIIIAAIPFIVIMIYTKGQRRLYTKLKPMPLKSFLPTYVEFFKRFSKIKGTGLFFARDINMIPPYIVRTMFADNIIYEDNLIVSLEKIDEPFGVNAYTGSNITDGLRTFVIEMGYMEVVDVEHILMTNGIDIKTIFYGLEDISTNNFIWKIFSLIKKLTPSYVQFYKLPSHKLRGVIYRIEM